MPSASASASASRRCSAGSRVRRAGQGKLRGGDRVGCLHPRGCGLQPDPPAQAPGSADMSVRGRVADRRDAGLRHGRGPPTSCSTRAAASSPSVASPAPSTEPATATPSSSPGRATTKWSQPTVMAGPNCRTTARSKAKSASTTATTSHSSPPLKDFFNSLLNLPAVIVVSIMPLEKHPRSIVSFALHASGGIASRCGPTLPSCVAVPAWMLVRP